MGKYNLRTVTPFPHQKCKAMVNCYIFIFTFIKGLRLKVCALIKNKQTNNCVFFKWSCKSAFEFPTVTTEKNMTDYNHKNNGQINPHCYKGEEGEILQFKIMHLLSQQYLKIVTAYYVVKIQHSNILIY